MLQTIRNATDAYVASTPASVKSKNYGNVSRLYFSSQFYTYMHWSNGIPSKARISRAVVKVRAGEAMPAGAIFDISLLAASWTATGTKGVTWNNKPLAVNVTPLRYTLPAAVAANGMITIPIDSLMQSVANGTKWYGIRISSTVTTKRSLHSMQATAAYRPVIEIEWAENPYPPTNLFPRSGANLTTSKPTLTWNFLDTIGNTTQGGYKVQISTSSTFATVDYDSGWVNSAVAEHRMADTAFSLAAGTIYYWRVMTRDGGGLESIWSGAETMRYTAIFTGLVLVNPQAADAYVEEPTPPITWTLPVGVVQTAYRIVVWAEGDFTKSLYDTGKISSTEQEATLGAGVITLSGEDYRIALMVYDNQNRVSSSGAPDYARVDRVFQYRPSATTSGFTALEVISHPTLPIETLVATRDTMPDSITLKRNGVVIKADMDPLPMQNPANLNEYRLTDMPPGRQSTTWELVAVVNGKAAATNAKATKTVKRKFPWLIAEDGSSPVALANPSYELQDRELVQIVEPVAGYAYPVVQDVEGETGSASGLLVNNEIAGLTARDMKNNLRRIRKQLGGVCMFLFADEAMKVFVYGVQVGRATVHDGNTEYPISFSFVQLEVK